MIMEKVDKQQVFSKLCSNLSTPLIPMILSLVLFSFFFFFSVSKSFPFLLTMPIALLSTLFLVKLTKKKGPQDENLVQDKLQKEKLHSSLDVTHTEVISQQSENAESHEIQAEAQSYYSSPSDSESINFSVMDKNFELNAQEHEQQADSQSDSSLPSDSESSNFSVMDKKFEFNAQEHEHEHEQQADSQSDSSLPSDSESGTDSIMCESFEIGHYGNQNVSSSDSLAYDNDDNDEDDDDEDSLIEINLPSSHFSGFTEEQEQKLESKLPDFMPESIFKDQDLMELLAEINEMNEDENLIEIDISMGSINSQDFRLKQELTQLGDQCVLSE